MKKIKDVLLYLSYYNFFNFLSDKSYLKFKYRLSMSKKLNLDNPLTFNEKLQWLKLYNRDNIYTMMVDKYEVKSLVSDTIGNDYVIPTLGIYSSFDDINFDKLPNKFVIKCTHDSGGLVIVKDKKNFNKEEARKKINKSLRRNYFYSGREWPYKNVKPRIIIEKYIGSGTPLNDYKIFCFNGEPKYILVCSNRSGYYKNTDFFDFDWNLLPFTRKNHLNNSNKIACPNNLKEMFLVAKKLSKDIPFVRVDLYNVKDKVFFGELTFFPSSGFEGFEPDIWDRKLGDMLDISMVNIDEK